MKQSSRVNFTNFTFEDETREYHLEVVIALAVALPGVFTWSAVVAVFDWPDVIAVALRVIEVIVDSLLWLIARMKLRSHLETRQHLNRYWVQGGAMG